MKRQIKEAVVTMDINGISSEDVETLSRILQLTGQAETQNMPIPSGDMFMDQPLGDIPSEPEVQAPMDMALGLDDMGVDMSSEPELHIDGMEDGDSEIDNDDPVIEPEAGDLELVDEPVDDVSLEDPIDDFTDDFTDSMKLQEELDTLFQGINESDEAFNDLCEDVEHVLGNDRGSSAFDVKDAISSISSITESEDEEESTEEDDVEECNETVDSDVTFEDETEEVTEAEDYSTKPCNNCGCQPCKCDDGLYEELMAKWNEIDK